MGHCSAYSWCTHRLFSPFPFPHPKSDSTSSGSTLLLWGMQHTVFFIHNIFLNSQNCDSLTQLLSHNLPQMCCFLSPYNHHQQHWLAFINNFLFYSKQIMMVWQARILSHCKGFSKYNFPHLQISIFGLELQVKWIQCQGGTQLHGASPDCPPNQRASEGQTAAWKAVESAL